MSETSSKQLVVYVDDEEENIFVFKRRFATKIDLKGFTDPEEALAFIQAHPEIKLVITDQCMPKMSGLLLAQSCRKVNPKMHFIMITGNPDGEADLKQTALANHKFVDFFQKPLQLETHEGEYWNCISGALRA